MKSFPLAYAALLLTLAPAAAQGSIIPYLPKETMVAMAAPDLKMSIADFQKMPLAKMWGEKEVQTFFADVLELAKKQIDQGLAQAKEMHAQGAFPIDPDDLLKLRLQGGAFAVTKMQLTMGERGPQPNFGMLLHLEFGESAPTWNKLVQMGLGMLEAQAGPKLTKQESMVGAVKLLTLSPPAEAGTEMALNVAMLPTGLLIGTLANDVRETVAAMTGKTPMLGAAANYQTVAQRLDATGAECEMFVRLDPLVDFGVSVLGMLVEKEQLPVDMKGVHRAVEAMGLRSLGASGMTSTYVDGKCVTRGFTAAGGNAATSAVKTIDTSFLKWVPKDAVGFGAGTLDVMSIYDTLVRGLEAYDAEMAKQMLGQLAEMEKQLGFNVRNDFFGSIGDHYISWSMPMGTISSPPELAFLIKVTDEKKLVTVLKNLTKLTNGMVEIEEGEKRGVMAYQIRVNFDPTQGMGGMNPFDIIQPTFAFKDGYMVAGFSPSDVKRVFQRMDRKEDDPKGDIRGNKEFAAVAETIPAGVTSLTFTDWKANFESLYQVATGLLAFVPMGDEVPIDMSLLPDSATLTKHLYGSVSWAKTDAKGTEMVSVTPFGPEVMLLAFAAVGAGLGVVASMRGF
jgi:hypothetical protein